MSICDTVKLLAKTRLFGNDIERCVTLHDYVRDEIDFGFTIGFENNSPEQTLQLKSGHCNAQADLFRALLNVAGIDARLRFVKLDKHVLRYFVPYPIYLLLPAKLFHAITEVNVNGKWLNTDSYIFSPKMFQRQKEKLLESGLSVGYGITKDAVIEWDATRDAFSQAAAEDVCNDNYIFPNMQVALSENAGNNKLFGIHFNQWLGCVPDVLKRVTEKYLNSRI